MPDTQTQIPGTETPAAPAASVDPASTATPAIGTGAAQNPSGEPAQTIGVTPGTTPAAPATPVEVVVPDGMAGALFGVDKLKESFSSSEDAQRAFDHSVEVMQGIKTAEEAQWKQINERNIEAIKRDPEMGGADFEQKITAVNRFIEANFSQESRALIAEMGNEPSLVRDLMRLSKNFNEDSSGIRGAAPTISDEEQKLHDRYSNSPEMWARDGSAS